MESRKDKGSRSKDRLLPFLERRRSDELDTDADPDGDQRTGWGGGRICAGSGIAAD